MMAGERTGTTTWAKHTKEKEEKQKLDTQIAKEGN